LSKKYMIIDRFCYREIQQLSYHQEKKLLNK
jgi:hypothetical protein